MRLLGPDAVGTDSAIAGRGGGVNPFRMTGLCSSGDLVRGLNRGRFVSIGGGVGRAILEGRAGERGSRLTVGIATDGKAGRVKLLDSAGCALMT